MTDQCLATPAPAPMEAYAHQFDGLFGELNQRNGFRRYLEGLLLPTERHKSLTGLANTERNFVRFGEYRNLYSAVPKASRGENRVQCDLMRNSTTFGDGCLVR